jgi:outer membrane murein-binding lipoprotein Lpp
VVTWIVVGAVVLGVLILATAVLTVLGRLHPLKTATRRLRLRAEDAERLQAKVATLQESMLAIQEPAGEAAERIERLTHRRVGAQRPGA